MEALKIESQTDQTPLESRRLGSTQRELAETQHLLDNADHRFDGAFASPVDGFAYRCLELVSHLDQRASVLRQRIRQWRETLLRARDDGDHGPSRCRVRSRAWHTQSRWRTKLASVQRGRLRYAECRRDGLEGGFSNLYYR